MHPILIFLHLGAAIMLLLWAVRMVRTGVERAHGAALRLAVRRTKGGVAGMALVGGALAIVLQSSTAVGILATGFASSGILSVATGIAAFLGADLGSALVVKILSFNLTELVPVLILVGATLFLKFENRSLRQTGRILLGIGFILMSLQMVSEATEPLRDSPALPVVMAYLAGDPVTAFIVAALLAWGLHSSVATVLLLVTFATSRVLPMEAALPMVLGANLGGGIVAVWLTRDVPLPARRIPLGNMIFRGTGAILALGLVSMVSLPIAQLGQAPGTQLVNFHVAFNFVLMVLALPFVGAMDGLTSRLWPEPQAPASEARPYRTALDRNAMATPSLARTAAKRELLLMGETVEAMLRPVMEVMQSGDPAFIARIRAMDAEVNRRHTDIKLFVAEMNRTHANAGDASRNLDLTSSAIDFEYIGDLVAKNLLRLAEDKARDRLEFSREGWAELTAMHERVIANMQLALNVLISADLGSARQLAAEKTVMRQMEQQSQAQHLARLQAGQGESIDTSDIHLEFIRGLKEINSLLIKVAYPILSVHGHLLESRVTRSEDASSSRAN